MLIGFALPPLLQLKNTPPARVLRKTVSAPPLRYGVSYLLALAALAAILWTMVRDSELVLSVLAGVLGVGLVLTLVGLCPGAPDQPTARRRGSGVALRPGERIAPRHRQRGANRRLRTRVDGAVAAGRGARRSAGGLAAQSAERCAEQFSGQYPPGTAPGAAGISAGARLRHAADVSHGACAHHCHQFATGTVAATSRRRRQRLCGTRAEPDLVRGHDGGQPIDRRPLVDGSRCGQAAGLDLVGIRRWPAPQSGGRA